MRKRPNETREQYLERYRNYMQDWRDRNYEREQKKWAEYYQRTKPERDAYQKQPHVIAKKRIADREYQSRPTSRAARKKYMRVWTKKQYDENPNYRLKDILRGRIHTALKKQGGRKLLRTEQLIGCTIEFLQGYIAGQFKDGMSWENKGKWHLDHIIPCTAFDLTKVSQQRKCFHYSNLQPLWGADNIRKGNKIIPFPKAA